MNRKIRVFVQKACYLRYACFQNDCFDNVQHNAFTKVNSHFSGRSSLVSKLSEPNTDINRLTLNSISEQAPKSGNNNLYVLY